MPLTARFVATVKTPGRYSDGGGLGLILRVEETGRRSWVQRLTINGRRRDMGLGNAMLVTLAQAREMALENARVRRAGGDPLAARREAAAIPTFEAAARQVHAANLPTWRSARHAHDFIASLETHVFPKLGRMRVDHIGPADVLFVLAPIWTAIPPTAQRVHQRISLIMRYAVAHEWRKDDPAAAIIEALPKPDRRQAPRKALPHDEVGAAVQAIRASGGLPSIRRVLEFIILTAVRSNEARGAIWSEFDLDRAVWIIPGSRMKTGDAHAVPLPSQAIDLLREMLAEAGDPDADALAFPGGRRGRPVNDSTLSKLVKDLGFDADVHGFRASFRQWAQERTSFPREIAEAALAHRVGSPVERAYARSDVFEKRRRLMVAWADYITRENATLARIA
jgi:integrase